MENHTVTAASGWQTLHSLITTADATDLTFGGRYTWSWLKIRNTHAAQTVIVKVRTGTTAPTVDSGENLTAVGGTNPTLTVNPGTGTIDGKTIWIKASGNSTTIDVSFVRAPGVN